MSIVFHCPTCNRKLRAPDDWVGRVAACPTCGTRIPVVQPQSDAPRPPPSQERPARGKRPAKPFQVPAFDFSKFEDLVDMTAMVDIVFFLLIFFMVTSMQGVASSIGLPPPDPQKVSTQGRRTVADFERDGAYVIVRIDRDNAVWLEGTEIPSEQELRVRLREARQGLGSKLLVLGSPDALHGTAVMVLDAGNDAGMDEVRLALSDEDEK